MSASKDDYVAINNSLPNNKSNNTNANDYYDLLEEEDISPISIYDKQNSTKKHVDISESVLEEDIDEDTKLPYRLIILVTVSQFMGYAILVSFQHKLKCDAYHLSDGSNRSSHEFGFAVSFLYIGNLVFRIAHNFVFAPFRPRTRVYIAMGAMMCSMFILGIFVFTFHWTDKHFTLVYIAYSLGGVGIGSFESNLLSAITPLGHSTKLWAIVGFPLGFAFILIGGFAASAIGIKPRDIYIFALCCQGLGMLLFTFYIPNITIKNNAESLSSFIDNVKHYKQWFPLISKYCIALMLNMFFVSLFSGVMFYVYNGKKVPMFGPSSTDYLPKNWFFCIYNVFTLGGDSISRRVAYKFKLINPFFYLLLSIIGAVLCFSKYAIIAPIGIFCIMYSNGGIYATTTKFIDTYVSKEYNLIALSVWLFVGDMGSVIGSNVISYIRDVVCNHHDQYVCTVSSGC